MHRERGLLLLALTLLLTACAPGPPPQATAVVLPQPTVFPSGRIATPEPGGGQVVEVRIGHVHDLGEIKVKAGDRIEEGQVLASLEGYAQELEWDVRLAEEQLEEARARLVEARGDLAQVQREAVSEQEEAVAEAAARVEALERRVEALGRQKGIADAKLTMAQAKTAYRKRWLEILQPLGEFDPWGDLPYLVGAQSGPQGPRSDLAYREALAKAEYDLRMAELEQTIAEVECADAVAELQDARRDLEEARAVLSQAQAVPVSPETRTTDIYEASVRISEMHLAQARAGLEETVIRSLVAGRVLEVQVDRVVGNEATITIEILTER